MTKVRISFQQGDILDHANAVWTADGRLERKDLPPGTASWCLAYSTDVIAALIFVCPCGCGCVGSMTIRREGQSEKPAWAWNGDKVNPTLEPSIQKTSPCRWHGFLERGWFVLDRSQAPAV